MGRSPLNNIPEDVLGRAMDLVDELARVTTPEEEFESRMNADGVVADEGMVYEDVDEMIADMTDDALMNALSEFMSFVRQAKEIVG